MKEFKWIPMSERQPEESKGPCDWRLYLTCNKDGYIAAIHWGNGWNCSVNWDGSVNKEYEMKDIVAWMELPDPYEESESNEK